MPHVWHGLVAVLIVGQVGFVYGETSVHEVDEDTPVVAPAEARSHLESVFVQDVETGHEVKGQLLRIGPDTLTLRIDGQRRDMALVRVRRIQVVGHSVTKGAWIGGLIGGVWCAWVCGQGLDHSTPWLAVVAANAGFGAAVGAGVGATIPRRVTIYQQPTTSLTTHRRGAWLTWRF
jgi:hypothetical protein